MFAMLFATGLDPDRSTIFVAEPRARARGGELAARRRDELRRAPTHDAVQGEVASSQKFVSVGALHVPRAPGRRHPALPDRRRPRSGSTSASTSSSRATSPSASTPATATRSRSRAASIPRSAPRSWISRSRRRRCRQPVGTEQGTVYILDSADEIRREVQGRRHRLGPRGHPCRRQARHLEPDRDHDRRDGRVDRRGPGPLSTARATGRSRTDVAEAADRAPRAVPGALPASCAPTRASSHRLLAHGAEKAAEASRPTLESMYERMGFVATRARGRRRAAARRPRFAVSARHSPSSQPFEVQLGVADAMQVAHRVADRLAHALDLVLAALVQRELEAADGAFPRSTTRASAGAVSPSSSSTPVAEAGELVRRRRALRRPLRRPSARRSVGARAGARASPSFVSSERAGRVDVEPPHRHDPRLGGNELDDRPASVRVARGGDDARGLVQEQVRERLPRDALAVDLDDVALRPRRCSARLARRSRARGPSRMSSSARRREATPARARKAFRRTGAFWLGFATPWPRSKRRTDKLADLAVFGANVQPGQLVAVTSYIGKEDADAEDRASRPTSAARSTSTSSTSTSGSSASASCSPTRTRSTTCRRGCASGCSTSPTSTPRASRSRVRTRRARSTASTRREQGATSSPTCRRRARSSTG